GLRGGFCNPDLTRRGGSRYLLRARHVRGPFWAPLRERPEKALTDEERPGHVRRPETGADRPGPVHGQESRDRAAVPPPAQPPYGGSGGGAPHGNGAAAMSGPEGGGPPGQGRGRRRRRGRRWRRGRDRNAPPNGPQV